uniref:Uncharacterized protein n=1 Tax=Pseudo-nitzschia delicatissima TaxID=44447 RepID=A0A7S0UHM9_9STRA|mmetsp:Transcript_4759/g.9883  ORF Transcript_4759/g.9883 Transcript_4759/m.9883 type:complete len:136 (+) Transcript_4759:3-410(+)
MIQDHQLILSVPIQEELQIPTAVEDDEPRPPAPLASPIHTEKDDDERIQRQKQQNTSIAVAYGTSLWKKFKGLVRVKDHAKVNYYHYSNERTFSMLSVPLQPPSILAYEKYRQDALEEFLAYALTITMDQTTMPN